MCKRIALILLSAFAGLSASFCCADTIRLKNGTSITADRTTEKAGVLEYFIGATRYTLPMTDVAGIDRNSSFGITVTAAPPGMKTPGSFAGANAGADSTANHPRLKAALPPAPVIRGLDPQELLREILNLGRVDERALSRIEAEGVPMKSALAYFLAADYEYGQNRGAVARRYMKQAVSLAPDQPVLRAWYSALLRDGEEYPEAIAQGERAVELAPRAAVPLRILGLAYYDAGRVSEAVNAWTRAQQIEPDDQTASYLDKAGREARVEEKFSERESSHFRLRYEGRQSTMAFRGDLLRTLERQFADLSRDLGFAPQQTILVILYTEEQFFDVTRAPAWAGGLNDGKLRIPVKGLAAVDAKLEQVLKHELTHSFIQSLAGGRCPGWLNEGLAQMEEPSSAAEFAPQLAALFTKGKAAPLGALARSFGQLTPQQAAVAYTESLAVTEYLRDRYGMRVVLNLLHSIAEGEPAESALQQVTGLNYARLESDVAAQLARR